MAKNKKKRYYDGDLKKGDFANLPADPVMQEYPKVMYNDWDGNYDTPEGVDRQMADDVMGARKQKKHRKY